MNKADILEQVRRANEAMQHWPESENNILEQSLRPTVCVARKPVDNRMGCRESLDTRSSDSEASDTLDATEETAL